MARSKETQQCPSCGARIRGDQSICSICGAQVQAAPQTRSRAPWMLVGILVIIAVLSIAWLARPWIEGGSPAAPTGTVADVVVPSTSSPESAVASASAPSPTATIPVVSPTAMPVIYTVQRGDNYANIAARFGLSRASLLEYNGLSESAFLVVGQELLIPPGVTISETGVSPTPSPSPTAVSRLIHIVNGETLESIALQHRVSPELLAQTNDLDPDTPLRIGQQLTIPRQTARPTSGSALQPAPFAEQETVVHTVSSGEYLGLIASKYGVEAEAIARANEIALGSILRIGQELVIPLVTAPGATPSRVATEPVGDQEFLTHKVLGETLATIAAKYEIDVEALARANTMQPGAALQVGQRLILPRVERSKPTPTPTGTPSASPTVGQQEQVTHVVQSGEYLSLIAAKYDLEVEAIAEANDMAVDAILQIGQKLIIPPAGGAGAPVASPTPRATPTSSRTPTSAPTPSPLPVVPTLAYPYRAPHLLAPVDGAEFAGSRASIMLNWTSVGVLGSDEWYLLQVGTIEENAQVIEVWRKATSWRVPSDLYPGEQAPLTFTWQVFVVKRDVTNSTVEPVSPESRLLEFRWK